MSVSPQPVAATPAAGAPSAPAGPSAPGASPVAAPSVPSGPTLGAIIAAAAPKPEVAPAPPAEAKPAELKAEVKVEAPVKTEPPVTVKPDSDLGKLLARIEAQDSVIAEMRTQLTKAASDAEAARGDVQGRLVDELLVSAEIQPKYYKSARAELASIDPKSDAAKAKLDEFVRLFPEALLPRTGPKAPDSAWLNRVSDQQKDPKATRGTMLGAISASDLAAQLAAVRRS